LPGGAVLAILLQELPEGHRRDDLGDGVEVAVGQEQGDEVVAFVVSQTAPCEQFEVLLNSQPEPFILAAVLRVQRPLVLLPAVPEDDSPPPLLFFDGCYVVALSLPFCPDNVPTTGRRRREVPHGPPAIGIIGSGVKERRIEREEKLGI
jgi:hypothetical protein